MNLNFAHEHRSAVEEFQRKHRIGLLTLCFTDVVGSTKLKQTLREQDAITALRRHHAAIREILQRFREGEEINTAGDSFFIVFAKPSDAVRFALLVQAKLRSLAAETGCAVFDRIGIHVGEVWIAERDDHEKSKDLYGIQVDSCARVASLGSADQILLTRFAFDSSRQVLTGEDLENIGPLSWLNHGSYILKGVAEPVEICEVGEVGAAKLGAPDDTEKVHRHISPDSEPVLGWRPAVGQSVPGTSWVLGKKLGEGGFGEVWLGQHATLKTRRVFKFCFRADRVRSLKREVTLFRLLKERIGDHPNIVGVLDVYFDEPPFYIIMDYAEGENLSTWCEARGGIGKIPLPARVEIVAQVADALQAAHDAGVIHRDVKPSNILVCGQNSNEPHVKLTDFGIGQVVSQDSLAGMTRLGFTQTMSSGSQSGTQMYMAPELIAGHPASIRSDIYSLGVVLYQLLVGDFSRPLTMDWVRNIRDAGLREDLMNCLAGNPLERFAGASQLARNLRQAHGERPRNVGWKRAAGLLYGDWGTSKAYVLGFAFAAAGYSSLPIIFAVCALNGLVAVNYAVICRCIPDGGGVYSAARSQGRLLANIGALLLIADLTVTAALSGWSGADYFNIPLFREHIVLPTTGVLIVVGWLNWFGPKRSGGLAVALSIPVVFTVVVLIGLSVPHLTFQHLAPLHGSPSEVWKQFVTSILALSGVEVIANMTGVLKLDPDCTPEQPSVRRESAKAIWVVAIEVVFGTALLGWAMLSIPQSMKNTIMERKPDMLRFIAEYFGALTFGSWFGAVLSWVIGILFFLLLLSAANTAMVAMINLLFVMARDGELPRNYTNLNRYGVPLIPYLVAVALPILVLLIFNDFDALASLCSIGVVGTIAVTTGVCAFNRSLPIKWHDRLLFGLTTAILFCAEITLAHEKHEALFFFVCFIGVGLALLGRRKTSWS